ncbi:MAG: hypothetical protein JWL61_4980 [Gemmatimonadetes bacterium]|nr:hypothetical protein [Gemmatimonadota bacterium]
MRLDQVRECDCAEWAPGIAKINGPIVLQQIRSGRLVVSDHFVPWAFCPWCGKALLEPKS